MLDNIPIPKIERLNYMIDLGWRVFFEKVTSGRVRINKESSMQLHYSAILDRLGELLCVLPGETFSLELESSYGKGSIDITCNLDDVKAALELKCFREGSNRAQDIDMYSVWVDIERLFKYDNFAVRRFICLTDHSRYPHGKHGGYAETFSIAQGRSYNKGDILSPQWAGKWKNAALDQPITVPKDVTFDWVEKDGWFYLLLDV